MDNWERFEETSLPNKESFYSNSKMENIDDIDYRHGNNVFKRFKLKNLENITIYMFKVRLYYWLMYLKTLEIRVSKYVNWILHISHRCQD